MIHYNEYSDFNEVDDILLINVGMYLDTEHADWLALNPQVAHHFGLEIDKDKLFFVEIKNWKTCSPDRCLAKWC